MNILIRTGSRVLLSISSDDLDGMKKALASDSAQECLSQLVAQLEAQPLAQESEMVDVWTDQASVQLRAITAFGDPLDLSSEEARAYAAQILECAAAAD